VNNRHRLTEEAADEPDWAPPHGPAWFDISTPDAARARYFYQELVRWPVKLIDETYALAGGHDG
jgi:hypothetical protein